MLSDVEWGEYSIDDLFCIQAISKMLTKETLSNTYSFPAYSSEMSNGGIIGYTNSPEFICDEKNPIFVIFGDHTRSLNVVQKSFSVLDNVKVLRPCTNNKQVVLFIISAWQKLIPNLGYARHWKIARKCKIQLPKKNGQLDFDLMEKFIVQIEQERLLKLNTYLNANDLIDCTLTLQEENVLNNYKNIAWDKFKIGVLFDKIKTKKLPFKADDLPKEATGKYTLPCLTSSFKNQGLNYYVPEEGATVLKNVISIPSNSDVYQAYFQSNKFTVLSDAYAIRWIYSQIDLLPAQYLFTVTCINKATDLPIYSYKNKLGGWNVVKTKYIQLPVKNGEPDYEIMLTLISAIKKLVIKDLILHFNDKFPK